MQIGFFEPAMLAALATALHELDQHYFGAHAATPAQVLAHLRDRILAPDSGVRVVVALDGGAVAALATVSLLYPAPEQRGQLFMKDLYVCRAWRGQGLGEQLMQFLARYAVQQHCVRFDWTTESTNTGARAFYDRLGAQVVPEKVYYRLTGDRLLQLAGGDAERGSPAA
jgi:ribosomal protein S18 acetylase RimI-like enzyme